MTASAVQAAVRSLKTDGLSLKTCNHYLRAIKTFSRWMHRDKRTRDDALAVLEAYNADTNPRHVRRELSPEELTWLVATTETRTLPEHKMPGPDRAMIYRLALGTGLRAKELRSLTPESFDLQSDPPALTLKAAHSKHPRRRTTDPAGLGGPPAQLVGGSAGGATGVRYAPPEDLPDAAIRPEGGPRGVDRPVPDAARDGGPRAVRFPGVSECGRGSVRFPRDPAHVHIVDRSGRGVREDGPRACPALHPDADDRPILHARLHDIQGALNTLPNLTRAPASGGESDSGTIRKTGTDDSPVSAKAHRERGFRDDERVQKWGQMGSSWRARRCEMWRNPAKPPLR